MSLSEGHGSRSGGPTVPVPTIRIDGGGDAGVVLGLGTKQLVIGAAVAGVAFAVVIGAVAAGTFFLLADGNQADTDLVPQGANSIAYVNVDQATSDTAIREVTDTWYELESSDVDSTEEALAEFEAETGLDPDDLHHATAFSTYDESTGTGAAENTATILRTDWSEDAFVAAVEDDGRVTLVESSYRGTTVYEPSEGPAFGTSSSWVAVLDDGTYVVGTESAVRDTVEIHQGDADPIDDDLLAAFESTRDGYVRFAFRLPEEQVPSRGGQIDTSKLREVRMVTGAYYTTSNGLGVEVTMHASSESTARDVEDVTNGGLSILRGTTGDDELKETLRDVEVTQEGETVTVTYENTVESITELLRALDDRSGDRETTHVQADATVSGSGGDGTTGTIDATWTSNRNAEYLEVRFDSAESPDDFARLSAVGDTYTYRGDAGSEVTVTVVAVGESASNVVLERTVSL